MRARGLASLLGLLAVGAAVQAQQLPALRAGARVRLSVRTRIGRQSFSGSLLFLDRDSVTIVRRLSEPAAFALRDLDRFVLSKGRPPALVYGIPAVGAVLGAWVASTFVEPSKCDIPGNPDPDCAWEVPAGVVGAGAGVVLSAIAVRFLVPEAWQEIPVTSLQVGAAATGSSTVRVGLRLPL